MKKNKMMRLASALLVAVLLSTSVISGTYAKYVTTNTMKNSARVAKWGVEITTSGSVFSKIYATTDNTRYAGPNSVESSDTSKLVAPGTTDGNTVVEMSGVPEVAYKVDYTPTLTLDGWNVTVDLTDDGVDNPVTMEYCPLVFNVNGTEYKIDGSTINTVAELKSKVEAAITGISKSYGPNTDLTTVTYPTVTWSWAYGIFDGISENDIKDTYLGDQAADGNAATVSLQVKTTVTQID
jgi:hypothetical protein